MTDEPAVNDAERAKALVQEYVSARQEVMLHVQLYKTQAKNGAILITALSGLLIPLLVGGSLLIPGTGSTFRSTPWGDLVVIFAVSTVAFFLVFSVLQVQFATQVLAARCVRLEEEINKCLGGLYFVWERLSGQIWSSKTKLLYKNPDTFVPLFSSLVVVVFAVVLPLVVVTAKILCRAPDTMLVIVVFFYVWYLFTVPIFAVCITAYATGPAVREDCRQLFQYELTGGDAPLIRSGLRALVTVVVVAHVLTWAFVLNISHPTVCAYFPIEQTSTTVPATPTPAR